MFRLIAWVIASIISTTATAQPTYQASNFAVAGDTCYLTQAATVGSNWDSTGSNYTWNFSSLTDQSQRQLLFKLPTEAGFSVLLWPFLYNANNVNLASTDNRTTAILSIQQTNPYSYFQKTNSLYRQRASSYTIVINGVSFAVRTQFDQPDTVYRFPLNSTYASTSHSSSREQIPALYQRYSRKQRTDSVKGYGTLITPAGSYPNCLRLVSNIQQIDSLVLLDSTLLNNDTSYQREISWLSPTHKYPLLTVSQDRIAGIWVTTRIEYLDTLKPFQPEAGFGYLPIQPNMGDTVTFQNTSRNAYQYRWDFGDPAAGTSNTSTLINPQKIFAQPGDYSVRLIAQNGALADTSTRVIRILPLNQTYTFTGNGLWTDPANWSSGRIPPSPFPATNQIIIDPVSGGKCILNVSHRNQAGTSFTVVAGKQLEISGDLKIQQ